MANTFSNLVYHIVFSTKNRQPMIQPSFRDELEKYITGVIKAEESLSSRSAVCRITFTSWRGSARIAGVAEMLRLIKANSSKWVNETPGLGERFEWQTGYGAFTVSQSQLERLREYVRGKKSIIALVRSRRSIWDSSIATGLPMTNVMSGVEYVSARGSHPIARCRLDEARQG